MGRDVYLEADEVPQRGIRQQMGAESRCIIVLHKDLVIVIDGNWLPGLNMHPYVYFPRSERAWMKYLKGELNSRSIIVL